LIVFQTDVQQGITNAITNVIAGAGPAKPAALQTVPKP
jgi:hypothetical protein